MRTFTHKAPKRDFTGIPETREFVTEVLTRIFTKTCTKRNFGTHSGEISAPGNWRWGFTDRILSTIPGTFGDYD